LELPDDLAVLVELADAGWYRFGRVWHQTVTRAFDMARDLDDARQRPLHKQLLVLGNLGTKFKSSENWREIQRNPLPYIVSSDDVTWSRDLGRAHRNELRKVGLYLRTQLQVAVSRRDAEIVGRLLDHGADPAVRVIDGGDNATALLMAFRVLGQDALARRSMVKLILEALDKRSPEVVQASVNARTTTTNSSAFSQAIETGDSWGVVELLNRGADVDCPVGGDEDSPLYLVMNYFLLAFRAAHQPEFFTDLHLASRDSVNLTRLNAPLPGSLLMRIIEAEMPGGSERASRLLAEQLTKQSSREERLALVRTLLSRGADPNRLQRLQKRYPLDFALEIDREAGTDLSSLIRDAGGYRVSLH